MIVLVEPNDSRAVRNQDNVLALYDLMINQKKSEEATAEFVCPAYIQHNPLIADGSIALRKYFGQVTRERAKARVVIHRIIAVGDYVWSHVNFQNLFNRCAPSPLTAVYPSIAAVPAGCRSLKQWANKRQLAFKGEHDTLA